MPYKQLLKNIIPLFSANLLGRIIWYIFTNVFIVKVFTITEYGLYSTALFTTLFIPTLIDFGTNAYLTKEAAKDPIKLATMFPIINGYRIVTLLILSILLLLYLFVSEQPINYTLTIALGLFYNCGISYLEFMRTPFRACQKFELEAKTIVFEKVFSTITGLILLLAFPVLLYKFKVAIFIATLNLNILFTIILIIKLYKQNKITNFKSTLNLKKTFNILKETLLFTLTGLLLTTGKSLIVIIIAYTGTQTEVALFSLPIRNLDMLSLIPTAFATAFFPMLSSILQNNPKDFKPLFLKTLFVVFLISTLTSLFFYITKPYYFAMFPQYLPAASLFDYSLIYFPFASIITIVFWGLYAFDKTKQLFAISVLSLVLNILFSLILIPTYSFIGGFYAMAFSDVFILITMFYILYQNILKNDNFN